MEPPTADVKLPSDTKKKETYEKNKSEIMGKMTALKAEVKEKKARSPAQIAAQQKALATLKDKRDKMKSEEEKAEKEAEADAGKKAELEKAKYEKAKAQRKRLPVPPSYVTMNDLDKFKNDLLSSLSTSKPQAPEPKHVERKPEPVPEVIKQEPKHEPKPIEKPVPAPKLTGHELLDRIFFNK